MKKAFLGAIVFSVVVAGLSWQSGQSRACSVAACALPSVEGSSLTPPQKIVVLW